AYLHVIAPQTFTDRRRTPWGAAINTDGPDAAPVREFFIHNALYWIGEFHVDGLRLDAVHALRDHSNNHFLAELAERVRSPALGRQLHLILENEENEAKWLRRASDGASVLFTAQWNDDVHHALHVAATDESSGYYADYCGHTERLGRALAEGFAFQGEVMPFRAMPRGEPSATLPPTAFVAFLQNHDQVGNRAFGDRITAIAPEAAVRAVAAIYLLLPQIPMLFMGEEWAAAQPFPFFCDFSAELAEAVRNGRREEFARFPEFHDAEKRKRIPDPTSETTFASAKLDWGDLAREPHAHWHAWYLKVLAMRRAEVMPRLSRLKKGGEYEVVASGAVIVRWRLDGDAEELVLEANLSTEHVYGFRSDVGRTFWQENAPGRDGAFAPFTIRWSIAGEIEPGGTKVGPTE
ncbi:MAG TPA: DUF3459 domain-containing protein, partial [Stellaceae bacterium]|nr:DUF3459 domain-containing protein [Stellaceae bacterium]